MEHMLLPQQVVTLLESNDLEMVQLGATLLQTYKHLKNVWNSLLESHCNKSRFGWEIVGEEIYIVEITPKGIWEQLKTGGFKHVYSHNTFNMNTLKDAIETFYNKNQQNETTKEK